MTNVQHQASRPSRLTIQLTKDLHISTSQSPPRPAGRPSGNTHPKSLRRSYTMEKTTYCYAAHSTQKLIDNTLAVNTKVLDLHVWHQVSTAKWTSCLHALSIGDWQLSCPAVLRLFYRSQRLDAETLGIFLEQLVLIDNLRR
jgi:hypothetical protein